VKLTKYRAGPEEVKTMVFHLHNLTTETTGILPTPPNILPPANSPHSIDEIDTEKVQNQAPEDVIRKRPLMRHRTLLLPAFHRRKPRILPLRAGLTVSPLLLATGLHAQTSRKHELADRGAESAQESIEGLSNQSLVSIPSQSVRLPEERGTGLT
jgi:hypothetical protein